jgi:hypothetical protein
VTAADGRAPPPSGAFRAALRRPIFLVSPPRSGSTLLFQTLIQSPGACSIGGESHGLIEGIAALHPQANGWESNRLGPADASEAVVEELSRRFLVTVKDRDGRPAGPHLRMIEKTPKNSLRIPFFDAAYPDSTFVYLYRDPRQTLSSMMEAWRSGRFRTYPRLPDWTSPPWSLLLVPGWRGFRTVTLAEIVARQWAAATDILLDDLAGLPPERVRALSYDAFVEAPQAVVSGLCDSLELAWDRSLHGPLPFSQTTVSAPDPEKWRANEAAIGEVWPIVAAAAARARAFLDERSAAGQGS